MHHEYAYYQMVPDQMQSNVDPTNLTEDGVLTDVAIQDYDVLIPKHQLQMPP